MNRAAFKMASPYDQQPPRNPVLEVLGVTELLEHIFLSLSPIEVIRLQRVSFKWNSTVKSSPRIQQGIFIAPFSCFRLYLAPHEALVRVMQQFPNITMNPVPSGMQWPCVYFNPCLLDKAMGFQIQEQMSRRIDEVVDNSHQYRPRNAILADYPKQLAQTDPTASWRKLLVTQHPSSLLIVVLWYLAGKRKDFPKVYKIEGELLGDALTIGDLMQKLEELISRCRDAANAKWHSISFIDQDKCSKCLRGQAHVPWDAKWEIRGWEKMGGIPKLQYPAHFGG